MQCLTRGRPATLRAVSHQSRVDRQHTCECALDATHNHALLARAGQTPCPAADREELQQFAEAEAEEEAEREEMLDSPAKRQRREEGTGQDFRCARMVGVAQQGTQRHESSSGPSLHTRLSLASHLAPGHHPQRLRCGRELCSDACLLVCAVLCLHVLPCHRQRLRLLRERDRQLSGYYEMGSSYGKPTPLVLLPFAEMLTAKTDNSLLWWVDHNLLGLCILHQGSKSPLFGSVSLLPRKKQPDPAGIA